MRAGQHGSSYLVDCFGRGAPRRLSCLSAKRGLPLEPNESIKGAKVLIVDDEALVALELAEYLGERGAEIIGPCHSVDSALELIKAKVPDAAVLNVDIDGEIVRPLAEALDRAGVPFVFETGFDPKNVAEISGTPHHEVVRKPYRRREVLGALIRALEARSVAGKESGLPTQDSPIT